MIQVSKNPNFQGWYKVCFFTDLIDEIKGHAKALRFAQKVARERKVIVHDRTEG